MHMPLVVLFDASLPQMADTNLASDGEIATLELWLSDVRRFRHQLAVAILRCFPGALAALAVNWNNDEGIFVRLAARNVGWSAAVIDIRTNRAEMLKPVADQTSRLSQQLSSERQAELSRRIALFSALTNLAP